MVDWHPRRLVVGTEWTVTALGRSEPIAVIRRLRFGGRTVFRAVTWAPTSDGRELIGYYRTGDAAAVASWRDHVDRQAARHEATSRPHSERGRG
ncbi:hypothetical protein [Amnibacterium kyonggiense]|uniref:hypothetical protein n=1 Tax=Amnibacterium kyonggiense TaxID=595671 RepID=UPI00105F5ADD|nr:hypothetical protein [Amnibacterium kyonggiense]